jgi:hypothetical protein
MKQSLRVLLDRLIDYAGLFPPAALTMQDAVRNYARHRDGEYAFALGRFVVPRERAAEVPAEFPLSILGVDEVKAGSADDVERIAEEAGGRNVYVEIADLSLVSVLAEHGLRAKIRTGGITADAFPAVGDVGAFLRECHARHVKFKATAGLHHPLRCVRPLTYEPNAAVGTMHGFLNVFLAAAMIEDAEEILAEEDPTAFRFHDERAEWRKRHVSTESLAATRRDFATSFGSCSFDEPLSDLRELGWL